MQTFGKSLKNPSYLQSSIGVFLFFCSWGIWWSFFQLWLTQDLKLSNTQVGTIYAINSVATLVIMLGYGIIQDRLGIKRTLVIAISALAALVGPFVQFVYAPLLAQNIIAASLLGSVFLSAGFMAGCSLVEALTERFSRTFGFEYGQSRAWGSFGYAIVALCAGFLFNVNPMLNFWLGSVFGVLMLLVYLLWVPAKERARAASAQRAEHGKTSPSLREMFSVLGEPSLWLLIVFIMFTNTFYTVFDQQMFPSYYAGLFPDMASGTTTYGILNSVQVFCESAMMGLVPLLMRKIGVRNALLLGAVVMCSRIGLCGIFHDPVSVSVIKMFHCIEVPLFCLPAFRYFTLHFDPKRSATLYMVGFQIASQVGQVILSTPLGMLHDAMGDRPTFLTISAMVFVALVYGFFMLKKDDEQVEGDPFVRE